jgi:hypothetical protein
MSGPAAWAIAPAVSGPGDLADRGNGQNLAEHTAGAARAAF